MNQLVLKCPRFHRQLLFGVIPPCPVATSFLFAFDRQEIVAKLHTSFLGSLAQPQWGTLMKPAGSYRRFALMKDTIGHAGNNSFHKPMVRILLRNRE
jgi:hypothetical protein